jgi:hypothetical protein
MVEDIVGKVAIWLLSNGWVGILVIGMGWLIYRQTKEIDFLRTRNSLLQDARVADAQNLTAKTVESINSVTNAVQGLTDIMRERRR